MKYIMALDSGSTGIRAILFNKEGKIIGKSYEETPPIIPKQGWIEYDPERLFNSCVKVMKDVMRSSDIEPSAVESIGITNQRGSFLLWERNGGKPVYNIISWADVRAADVAECVNSSSKWKLIKKVAKFAYVLTHSDSMLQASIVEFTTDHASIRLKWLLDNHSDIGERAKKGELAFGTIDSWLIYRLTGRKVHATDIGNASATGLYDTFKRRWHTIILPMFDIPPEILPEVKDTSDDYGETDPSLFGKPLKIGAAVGDQMAAMFGQCRFGEGDVKITHGSGSFVDVNTGSRPRVSKYGLYPLIAWKIGDEVVYMLEGINGMTGTFIDWAVDGIGLASTPHELDELADSVDDTEGVYFVPALGGIRFPYFDAYARGAVIGLSLKTGRAHICRAILEGIAFRMKDILSVVEKELGIKITTIAVDGGVSASDPLLQFSADILNKKIIRPEVKEMTALGAAYLAGLSSGFWKDKEELVGLYRVEKIFEPSMDEDTRRLRYLKWKDAVKRSLGWSRFDPEELRRCLKELPGEP